MEFYIDLGKSLNFAKLVKKAVQVRGKNGKVFTRMQWVSPMEASTGMGVRKITSQKGYQQAVEDGINKHEHFFHSLDDQKVNASTFEDHHPHFFLPETEESFNNKQDRLDEHRKNGKYMDIINEGDHSVSFMHDEPMSDDEHPVYDKYHFVGRETDDTDDGFLSEHDIHPEIHGINQDIQDIEFTKAHKHSYDRMDVIHHEIQKHWHTIKSHVEDSIRRDHKGDDPETTFVRNIQLTALREGNMTHKFMMAQHPSIARAAVNKILGKDTADEYRKEHMKDFSIAIQFPGKDLAGIEKKGYYASQLPDYIRKFLGDDGLEAFNDILENHDSFESQVNAIRAQQSRDGKYSWADVIQRAKAEYDALGMEFEDRKPTYVTINPNGKQNGPCPYYGNRWLKIDDSILKNCTATLDDTFFRSESFAKVHSVEHLKDIFILKQLERGEDVNATEDSWMYNWGDIPIELQLHKEGVERHQMDIMPNPADLLKHKAQKLPPLVMGGLIYSKFNKLDVGTPTPTQKMVSKNGGGLVWETTKGYNITVYNLDKDGRVLLELSKPGDSSVGASEYATGDEIEDLHNKSYPPNYQEDDLNDEDEFLDDDDYGDLDLGDDEIDKLLADDDDDDSWMKDLGDLDDLEDFDLDDLEDDGDDFTPASDYKDKKSKEYWNSHIGADDPDEAYDNLYEELDNTGMLSPLHLESMEYSMMDRDDYGIGDWLSEKHPYMLKEDKPSGKIDLNELEDFVNNKKKKPNNYDDLPF